MEGKRHCRAFLLPREKGGIKLPAGASRHPLPEGGFAQKIGQELSRPPESGGRERILI